MIREKHQKAWTLRLICLFLVTTVIPTLNVLGQNACKLEKVNSMQTLNQKQKEPETEVDFPQGFGTVPVCVCVCVCKFTTAGKWQQKKTIHHTIII